MPGSRAVATRSPGERAAGAGRGRLVDEHGWRSEAQLLDAVATPGIFPSAFVFVAARGPLVPRLRCSSVAGAVLDGVNCACLALMGVVTVQLATTAVFDGPTFARCLGSTVCPLRLRLSSSWLVLGGAVAGRVVHA